MEQITAVYLEFGEKLLPFLAVPTAILLLIAAYNKKANVHGFVSTIWNRVFLKLWNKMTGVSGLRREMNEGHAQINKAIKELTGVVKSVSEAQAHISEVFARKLTTISEKQDKMSSEFEINGGDKTVKDIINKIEAIQWAELYEDTTTIIGLTDLEGSVTQINRMFSRITGRDGGDFLGSNWINVIHPKDRERIIKEWSNAVKYKRDYDGEFLMLDSNDKEIKVESRAKRLPNASGYFFKINVIQS